jgi:hypothetical protein
LYQQVRRSNCSAGERTPFNSSRRAELLAELANLDREEELLQEQQVQQIDNAYDNFIEQQSQYIEFSKRFYAKETRPISDLSD